MSEAPLYEVEVCEAVEGKVPVEAASLIGPLCDRAIPFFSKVLDGAEILRYGCSVVQNLHCCG